MASPLNYEFKIQIVLRKWKDIIKRPALKYNYAIITLQTLYIFFYFKYHVFNTSTEDTMKDAYLLSFGEAL